jgi:hypothetical protein
MRYAGNFNPEWGYLAPGPGFMRTARVALVTGAIGTVAGMAVAMALVARPAADPSVAARTMVQPSDATTPVKSIVSASNAELLQSNAQPVAPPPQEWVPPSSGRGELDFTAAESHSATTVQKPASVAALAEAPAVSDDTAALHSKTIIVQPPKTALVQAPRTTLVQAPRKMTKRVQLARAPAQRSDQNLFEGRGFSPFNLIGRTILGANPFWSD